MLKSYLSKGLKDLHMLMTCIPRIFNVVEVDFIEKEER